MYYWKVINQLEIYNEIYHFKIGMNLLQKDEIPFIVDPL